METTSKLGTIVLSVIAATGASCVHCHNTALLDQIAEAAGIANGAVPHLNILQTLGQDARFRKAYTHVEINGQSRRIRVFYPATAPSEDRALSMAIPADPWRRRVFVGTLLGCDPHDVTPTQSAAVAAVLPAAFAQVAPLARERILRLYGLDGTTPMSAAALAPEDGSHLTVRRSVARAMERLGGTIRSQLPALPEPTPPTLLGDPRVWERVDCSDASGCWIWQGTLDRGYPVMKLDGRKQQVMKYIYEQYYGAVPTNHYARPTCGTAICVRPDHLDAVTTLEAMQLAEGARYPTP